MKKYEKNLNDQSRAAMTPTEVEISLHLSSGDAKAIRQSPRWGKEEKKVTKKIFFSQIWLVYLCDLDENCPGKQTIIEGFIRTTSKIIYMRKH